MRKTHPFILILSLCGALAACGGEEEAESSTEATTETASDEAAPAEEAPAEEEAATESACARVSSCCDTMGQQWGGGSQRDCQAMATGGDEQACTDYLARNAQINGTEDHPLQGQVFAECMPAE